MAANNTTLPGTGDVYAAEDRGGVKHQRVLVEMDNTGSVDAFGKLRVSSPVTIFDSKLIHLDKSPLFWDESLETGAGISTSTPTAAKPYIDFTTSLNTAGKFTRQTFRRFNYQPGKSQQILMTGVMNLSGGGTGVERRMGLFDDNNGIFFEDNAGTYGVTVRTNDSGTPVDTTVVQASWNLDVMDGTNNSTNPSGITLDWTKAQIFVMDFQWLSIGRVRFGLEIAGKIIYVHEHLVANLSIIPWTSTPNLPLRCQVITTASSPISTMRTICAAVISEGGTDSLGIIHRRSTEGAALATTTENTLYALVGMRLRSTHLSTSVEIINTELQIQSTSEYMEWVLIFNPTIAGSVTYGNHASSSVETFLGAATNTVTGGTDVAGGYIETGNNSSGGASIEGAIHNALQLGVDIAGTADVLALCVRPIGGVSAVSVEGAISWREL